MMFAGEIEDFAVLRQNTPSNHTCGAPMLQDLALHQHGRWCWTWAEICYIHSSCCTSRRPLPESPFRTEGRAIISLMPERRTSGIYLRCSSADGIKGRNAAEVRLSSSVRIFDPSIGRNHLFYQKSKQQQRHASLLQWISNNNRQPLALMRMGAEEFDRLERMFSCSLPRRFEYCSPTSNSNTTVPEGVASIRRASAMIVPSNCCLISENVANDYYHCSEKCLPEYSALRSIG